MKVEVARLFPDAEKVKAVINAVFDNSFVVHGIKIIDSEKGLFVVMPNIKVGDKHKDTFHPINQEARKQLCEAIFEAYEASKLNAQNTAPVEETPENKPKAGKKALETTRK
ncbi:MAG TPA: septation protein SpoVG [Clostridiales bacterium]|nr:septation protein SpoVG [Clostridiales bacterium]